MLSFLRGNANNYLCRYLYTKGRNLKHTAATLHLIRGRLEKGYNHKTMNSSRTF